MKSLWNAPPVGSEAKDQEQRKLRHPKIPFHAYSVSAEDVAQVARARRRLFGPGVKQPDEPLLQLYRKGEASRVADAE